MVTKISMWLRQQLKELKTLKVMVVHNIGTLANNRVKDGKEAHV